MTRNKVDEGKMKREMMKFEKEKKEKAEKKGISREQKKERKPRKEGRMDKTSTSFVKVTDN